MSSIAVLPANPLLTGTRQHRPSRPAVLLPWIAGLILVLALALPATAPADHEPRWKPVPSGSAQQYRGLDAVDKRTAWVGGSAGEARATPIALGPTGSDVSHDGGRRWTAFDTAPYDAVDCVPQTCWASGPAGAVAVLT